MLLKVLWMKASLHLSNWLCLLIGILGGWVGGWWLGNQRVEKAVIEAYPEEVRPAVEAAAELLGEMDKEEVEGLLEDMREFAKQTVREGDLQLLWQAFAAYSILLTQKDGEDLEGAVRKARAYLEYFVESYDYGDTDVADWDRVASALREAIDREGLLPEEEITED